MSPAAIDAIVETPVGGYQPIIYAKQPAVLDIDGEYHPGFVFYNDRVLSIGRIAARTKAKRLFSRPRSRRPALGPINGP